MLLSDLIDLIDGWSGKFSRDHFVRSVLVLIAFTIAVTGVSQLRTEEYRRTAESPFTTRKDIREDNNFQRSPLLPLVAHYLRLTSRPAYNSLCFAVIVIGYLMFAYLAKRRYGPHTALVALALLLSHPVTLVLLSWIGMPDSVSFVLAVALLFTQSVWAVGLVSLLGALNHPVMVFAAPAILVLRMVARREGVVWRHLLACVVGLVGGIVASYAFLSHFGIDAQSRFSYIMQRPFSYWLTLNTTYLPSVMYSFHGTVWLALVASAIVGFSRDRAYYATFGVLQILAYAVTFFTRDTTRVFALLVWAPAMHCVLHSMELAASAEDRAQGDQLRKAVTLIALVGIAVPGYIMWDGRIQPPPFTQLYSRPLSPTGEQQ